MTSSTTSQLSALIEALVPDESAAVAPLALLSPDQSATMSTLVLNVNQQFVLKDVEGNVIQNVQGTIDFGPTAKQLLSLIDRYGGDQKADLKSALYEFEDLDAPSAGRRNAKLRLTAFLRRVADSVQGVATSVLAKYLENKIGI
jgi:hypothetical protein